MAISNELSSEIAAAILQENKSPKELERLKRVVLEVHSTLQQMSRETKMKHVKVRRAGIKGPGS